jgi:hypothetical protein
MDEMEAVGPNNFMVARFNMNEVRITGGHDGPPWGNNPKITVEEARRIAQLPAVRQTVTGLDHSGEFVYGRTRLPSVSIAAREAGWTGYSNATIIAGHDMLPNDVRASAPVVLLSEPLAEAMFGALDPIGRTIRIRGKPFQVIGVFRLSESVFSAFNRNLAIMPYTSALKHLERVGRHAHRVHGDGAGRDAGRGHGPGHYAAAHHARAAAGRAEQLRRRPAGGVPRDVQQGDERLLHGDARALSVG